MSSGLLKTGESYCGGGYRDSLSGEMREETAIASCTQGHMFERLYSLADQKVLTQCFPDNTMVIILCKRGRLHSLFYTIIIWRNDNDENQRLVEYIEAAMITQPTCPTGLELSKLG